jgi:hypothetical protein
MEQDVQTDFGYEGSQAVLTHTGKGRLNKR